MVKNIEQQRARKVYKQEKQEDPPGVSRERERRHLAEDEFLGSISTTGGLLQTC